MSRKFFILCLLSAVWTILQTSFHLVFVVYGYFMSICKNIPSDTNSIFFYLTYLYNSDCTVPELTNSSLIKGPQSFVGFFTTINSDPNATIALEEIVKTLLNNLEVFPTMAVMSSRTSVFLLCFIILDGAWIVSAVSLLMGICFGIKEFLSLVFYGPWLVMTICVAIFDAVATVFFGFDIPATLTFGSWRDFVGISPSASLPDYDAEITPQFLFAAPSLAICSVSSRFVLIWITNWICFVFVLKATISVYRESYKNESPQKQGTDHDTSAARIRNWQLFYGTTETRSSVDSGQSVESEKDLNSNKETVENKGAKAPNSGDYFAFPDVVSSPELMGQLPWSYTRNADRWGRSKEVIELGNSSRREQRLKSDASSSGTEL